MTEIAGNVNVPPIDPARRRRIRADRRLQAAKARYKAQRTLAERFSDVVVASAATKTFLAGHVIWFGLWLVLNASIVGLQPFDPYPFGLLTTIVSLEAIGLAIFILMSQNRDAEIAEMRAEVTLEVSLRIEEEVTKSLQLITGLYRRLNLPLSEDPELREMLQPLEYAEIERELSTQIRSGESGPVQR